MFKVRKDIHDLKQQLNFLNETCQKKGSSDIYRQIEETTEQLQHLRVRMHILEKLCGKFQT
jgi:flagellar biosynthesis chaperone FliJ